MRELDRSAMDEWLASKAPEIRELAEEFPPGDAVLIDSVVWYVVGYGELKKGVHLMPLCSPIDPFKDYDGAVDSIERFCSHCVCEQQRSKPN